MFRVFIFFIFVFIVFGKVVFADISDISPKVGVYFGTITPILELSDDVNTGLGFSVFFRFFIPKSLVMLDLDGGYNWMYSTVENELYIAPFIASVMYNLRLNLPLLFYFKLGVGGVWEKVYPENVSNWDPAVRYGLEISFPAGKVAYIGARFEHLFVYQKYIEGAEINGNFIYFGIFIAFNLSQERRRL